LSPVPEQHVLIPALHYFSGLLILNVYFPMGRNLTFLKTLTPAFAIFCMALCLPALALANVSVTINSTNVSCFGGSNGTATALPSGGWAPYFYLWSTGSTNATITNLSPGTYTVTVTDIDLGTASASVQITQPTQLGVTLFSTSQICGIVPDGTASAVPFGGTPPYAYTWNTGAATAQVTGLAAGTYTVTVTDANGCTTSGSVNIGIFFNEGLWIGDMTTNVLCFGQSNGSATAMPMSGTPPYTYLWNTGATTMKIENIAAGTYTVTVTDANGCQGSHIFTITQPTALVTSTNSTAAACTSNGTATVTPSGGTPPYSIIWSNGQTNFTINGLAPGTYSATVTDANGCGKAASVTVTGNNTGLSVAASVSIAAGCNIGGSAAAAASNGSGSYTYLWDNGQTTSVATNLSVGNHSVTVMDAVTGCSGTAIVNIPQATPIITTIVITTNATCNVGGTANASSTGGIPPYTYAWSNGQTGATVTNLVAGTYTVTATDATNCIKITSITITQSTGPTVSTTLVSNATCTSGGSATVTASGGLPPYSYLWSNGQTTTTATNLAAGTRTVTVTDANGCAAISSIVIGQAGTPNAAATVSTQATCLTGGSATATGSAGTAPYTYTWSTGATTATVTNLSAGTYTVTVRDANNCSATASVVIVAPPVPTVVISASSNANCTQPGSATAMAAGGAAPYTYKWSNNEMTATAVNLAAGTYTVTVTGTNGCTATASVTIGQTNNGITIGDYVWYDNDQDGFQNPLETSGVSGVTVMLMRPGTDGIFNTADDVMVGSTTTNAAGLYQFTCVTPGQYILKFTGIPSGYEWTKKDNVPNNCKDSDVKANGQTDPFTIVSGQGNDLCFDAGIHIICENVVYPGEICCNQTICEGDTPAAITQLVPASGGSGTLQYLWMEYIQVPPSPTSTWVGIPNTNSPNYQPGPLTQTSYFMRCVRREGCTTFFETNIVTITVNPAGSAGCGGFSQGLAVNQNGPTSVLVTWDTEAEQEMYLYTVQHSANNVDWDNVATEMAHQSTTGHNSYSVVHQTPVVGMNHYRIMRTMPNGVSTNSDSKSIDLAITTNGGVSIYPNPVQSVLTIKNIAKYDGDVEVAITATNGDLMRSVIIPSGTLQRFEVPVQDLPAGMYFARIRFADGSVKTVKVSKF
jgi:SdrD B-like domain/SprB repeat/Secretion system C-terminal sorting domain